jgi:hypothetical protein
LSFGINDHRIFGIRKEFRVSLDLQQ